MAHQLHTPEDFQRHHHLEHGLHRARHTSHEQLTGGQPIGPPPQRLVEPILHIAANQAGALAQALQELVP